MLVKIDEKEIAKGSKTDDKIDGKDIQMMSGYKTSHLYTKLGNRSILLILALKRHL